MSLSSLAFLPVEMVGQGFDSVRLMFPFEEHGIPNYFEATYIGTIRAGSSQRVEGPREALFPPAFWNVNFRRQWGLPTTTNTCESFHMHQLNVHHAHHPDIPTFLVNIQRQVAKVDLRIAEFESGKCLIPNRTLLRNVDQYGSTLTRLAGGNLVDIISQISHVRMKVGDAHGGFRCSVGGVRLSVDDDVHPESLPVPSHPAAEPVSTPVLMEPTSSIFPASEEENLGNMPSRSGSVSDVMADDPGTLESETEVLPVVVREVALCLSQAGYSEARHGPTSDRLLETILTITAGRLQIPSGRSKGRGLSSSVGNSVSAKVAKVSWSKTHHVWLGTQRHRIPLS